MIRSLNFDGYRSFPARRQFDRKQPFQTLNLAPLTLLIGRNNSGKTSVATLLHQVLTGLTGDFKDALPLAIGGQLVAASFQDFLHARDANKFLELDISVESQGVTHRLETILYLPSLLEDDLRPWARSICWDGKDCHIPDRPLDNGLLPELSDKNAVQAEARQTLRDSIWLGPLRNTVPEMPSRITRSRHESVLDSTGKGAVELLAEDEELFSAVSLWLREYASISLRWEKNLELRRLKTVRGDARDVSITQAGAGIHQLLPVLTLAKWRQHRCGTVQFIDIVQQPELHLHDALQPALGDLFIDTALAANRGVTVVETHAEGLLLRVRRRVAEGKVKPEQIALYHVNDAPSGSELRRINLLENGEVDWWPEGVFLESFEEVKALRRAQRQRG